MVSGALLRQAAFAAPTAVKLAPYAQPLQVPPLAAAGIHGPARYHLREGKISRVLHPALAHHPTRLWSYRGVAAADPSNYRSYLGPTFMVNRGHPLEVSYTNELGATYANDAPWLPLDLGLVPGNQDLIVVQTHLHGLFVNGQMDGNPAIDGGYALGETQTVWYWNAQRATMLWYHDHAHGATRLNIFAGLAGAYIIRDRYDTGGKDNANRLPVGYGKYEIPLIFQDRQFVNPKTTPPPGLKGGDFLYPTTPQTPGDAGAYGMCGDPPYPYGSNVPGPWISEFYGDEMLVNGLVTPFLNVEPRVYRFRLLNACGSRMLNLRFKPEVPFLQIGADGGMFGTAIAESSIVMVNAERADILVDFKRFAGKKVVLENEPLPKPYATPQPALPDVIRFNVGTTVTDHTNNAMPAAGTPLAGGEWARLSPTPGLERRKIILSEWNSGAPHWYLTVTGSGGGGIDVPPGGYSGGNCFDDPISERPPEGAVQNWDLVNTTMCTHPIHLHLVQFQVVKRWKTGTPEPPEGTGVLPHERGFKDTVAAHPGMTTQIRAKFDLPPKPPIPPPKGFVPAGTSPNYNLMPGQAERTYVYHCHITEHEDNDMMRPYMVSARRRD